MEFANMHELRERFEDIASTLSDKLILELLFDNWNEINPEDYLMIKRRLEDTEAEIHEESERADELENQLDYLDDDYKRLEAECECLREQLKITKDSLNKEQKVIGNTKKKIVY